MFWILNNLKINKTKAVKNICIQENSYYLAHIKEHVTVKSSKLEPAMWSHDTGQRKLCFDRCQLTMTLMSNIKEGRYKPRLYFSVSLLAGGRHLARLRCRRRAYAPTSNTAGFPLISHVTYVASPSGPSCRGSSAIIEY